MSVDEFESHFDRFSSDVFRLETLQAYAVSQEDEALRAFREGTARPVRSVRTSPWLARIALTTTQGKHWQRIHVVDHPLSVYLRYELVGYVESQAVGEEIRIADRGADPATNELRHDFWLFDRDSPDAHALLMRYDEVGHFIGFERTTNADDLHVCRAHREIALRHSVGLNTYLAAKEASA